MAGPRVLLSSDGLCKDYAVRVLSDVSFELRVGEIHALLGANGAGKSTLGKLFAGLTPASAGEMFLEEQPYRPTGKRSAEERGVQIVQQELNLVPTLSVAENLFLNRLPHRFGWIDRKRLLDDARSALRGVGLDSLDPGALVGSLGVGTRQLVEIAAALVRDCRVLILDEPTAALTNTEVERLFSQLIRLKVEGVGVVYVSHRLEEIEMICDRLTVLRDGHSLGTHQVKQTPKAEMVRLMTGDSTSDPVEFRSHRRDQPSLGVRHLCRGELTQNVSFGVQRGERLGVAGLVGSGRTELLRTIFGADVADSGGVVIGNSEAVHLFKNPRHAVAHGLAMVTEDRKQDGLLLSQSVRVNTTLPEVPATLGWIHGRREVAAAQAQVRALDTRCRGVGQSAGELSGGNQQKVVVGKWLECDASVFLLDEPTRGIDVAARQRIYHLLDDLAERGKGLLIVSSDLEELMELCDAIVVMRNGSLVDRFERRDWTRQAIMTAMFSRHESGGGEASVRPPVTVQSSTREEDT